MKIIDLIKKAGRIVKRFIESRVPGLKKKSVVKKDQGIPQFESWEDYEKYLDNQELDYF